MRLTGLRCTDCGTTELVAVWPGKAAPENDLFTLLPHRPVRAWCELCWTKRFGLKPKLPRRGSRKVEGEASVS